MNLSKRGKWLTGIAALIAAYVAFVRRIPIPSSRRAHCGGAGARAARRDDPVGARGALAAGARAPRGGPDGGRCAVRNALLYVAPPPPPPAPE